MREQMTVMLLGLSVTLFFQGQSDKRAADQHQAEQVKLGTIVEQQRQQIELHREEIRVLKGEPEPETLPNFGNTWQPNWIPAD